MTTGLFMSSTQSGGSAGSEGSQPLCRFCGAALTDTFVDLGLSPLCEKLVRADQPDRFYPLHAWVCRQCLLVQLEAVVTPQELFDQYD
jgi:hypothetical protein